MVYNSAFDNLENFNADDEEDAVNEDLEKVLFDPESRKWYKRVLKWTNQNKRAYCWIKSIQMLASISMLTTTLLFALLVWTRQMYMH